MRRYFTSYLVILLGIFFLLYPSTVFAGSLDDLSRTSGDGGYVEGNNEPSSSGSNNAISDYIRDYTPVTEENMQAASAMTSGIVSFLGTVTGGIVLFVGAAIFCVTAADLAYIGLPFMRPILNVEYASGGAQAGGMPGGMPGMPGMGGRGYGMAGGMSGMPGAGGGGQVAQSGLRRKWISDEADYCVRTYCQPQGQQVGAMPGSMMGGMPGMPGGAQQAAPVPMKSVIAEYLKKRVFFLIIFAMATVLLTSSVFTHCGINLAELLFKIMDKLNGKIATVNV